MPDRLYLATHHPPRLSDRIAAHWAEVGIAILGVVRGTLTLADSHLPFFSPAILGLPMWQGISIAVLLVLGGIVWLWSICRRFPTVNAWWQWQAWGLSLSALGWAGYFLAGVGLRPQAVQTWVSALVLSGICWGMWGLILRAARRHERRGADA